MQSSESARPSRPCAKTRWRGALLWLVLIGPAVAQDSAVQALGGLDESLEPTRPVSGSLLIGVALHAERTGPAPLLGVYLSAAWSQEPFCVWLRSRDGRYRAHQRFKVRPEFRDRFTGVGSFTKIPLAASEHGRYLEGLAIGDIAPLVVRGDCRPTNVEELEATAAFWKLGLESAVRPEAVSLYLNSLGADEAYVITDGGKDFDCTPLKRTDAFEFDHECRIPFSALDPDQGPLSVEINRIKDGAFDRSVRASIDVPPRR